MRTSRWTKRLPPLFRKRGAQERKRDLEGELADLERQARSASPGYETQFLNRAGNICVEAGDVRRALGYYGRAIDAYLETGRFSAAEVLATRLLQLAPDAVRPRCTIAWLAIGKGYGAGAAEIADYVRAAKEAGMEHLAAKQLSMMAAATASPEVREILGEHLLDLGAFEESERVLGAVYEELSALRSPRRPDNGKLWGQLLHAALMDAEALGQAQRPGPEDDEAGDQLPTLGD